MLNNVKYYNFIEVLIIEIIFWFVNSLDSNLNFGSYNLHR